MTLRFAALAVALASGCAGPQRPPPQARGVLVVTASLPAAAVWIDERLVGEARLLGGGINLTAGTHRVELRLDGYHTRYAEVSVAAGQTRTVALELTEEQP